jgi:pyruvate/2-oxoglutarate dehydrogenase complex dihydrolipoamide dehydrogenase (E3) component
VVARQRYTHVADAHARMVVRNALFFGRRRTSELVVPGCVFTSPELAHVGAEYTELERREASLDVITVPFAALDRAAIDNVTEGFARVHVARGSDRIAGATIVGRGAAELIGLFGQAMSSGAGLRRLSEVIYPYPTYGEIVRKVADEWNRRRLSEPVKSGFRAYFRTFS